ncbi:hypothetical protein E2542_SST04348 [Spatholobus suberectus]|nr:hypothetical protein E2542_SST04348 [Spatholobus suberectus]
MIKMLRTRDASGIIRNQWVQPTHTPPVQPTHTPPVEPTHTPPVQAIHTPPVQPTHTPPIQATHTPLAQLEDPDSDKEDDYLEEGPIGNDHVLVEEAQSQDLEESTTNPQEIQGTTKLQYWKETVGGKTKGWCYGTGDLASNIRPGVSFLTQECRFAPTTSQAHQYSVETEALRQQVQRANEQAAAANARVDEVTIGLHEANQKYTQLEEKMRLMQDQLQMLFDRQSGGSSTGTSQVHPHYAEDLDDHHLDKEGPLPRQRRRC